MKSSRISSGLIMAGLVFSVYGLPQQSAMGQSENVDVTYVLERYIETMGGRAALQNIRSTRLSGTITYANGLTDALTVLKKKPNLVRIVLDKGPVRFVQAYDGKVAWYARETGRSNFHDLMRGDLKENFIREAPLENVLVRKDKTDAEIKLGEDIEIAGVPCFQVIATFPNGRKLIHHIEKSTFLERRILEFDREGELVSELIPAGFEVIDGVTFSRKITRINNGKTLSTLYLDEITTNAGILDTIFSPPADLPPE